MKKLFVLATLLAALASFGCGSDEPSANAPAKVPTSTTKSTKDVVKTEKLSDGSTVETTKSGSTITTRTDGKKFTVVVLGDLKLVKQNLVIPFIISPNKNKWFYNRRKCACFFIAYSSSLDFSERLLAIVSASLAALCAFA